MNSKSYSRLVNKQLLQIQIQLLETINRLHESVKVNEYFCKMLKEFLPSWSPVLLSYRSVLEILAATSQPCYALIS